ncbi:unnamed protein product [Urochloa humidicola]
MALEHHKQPMAEPLLEQPFIEPPPEDSKGAWLSPLKILGFAFLTFNSAMGVSSWNRGFGTVSFVAFFYLDLVTLFYCLPIYQMTPPGSPRQENFKVAMWLLTTMLTISCFQLLDLFWFLSIGTTENSDGSFHQGLHDYSILKESCRPC